MVKRTEMREGRHMPLTGPSLLDLDVLRASLGASATAPYEHPLGPLQEEGLRAVVTRDR